MAMDIKTAETLHQINNEFYRRHGASFSKTRSAPWPGWHKCLATLRGACPDGWQDFSVFDLACGNLRFEAFLASAFPESRITVDAVDNCDSIVPQAPSDRAPLVRVPLERASLARTPFKRMPSVNYQSLDVLGALCNGQRINDQLAAPLCDLSVSFGFMHHVPLPSHRKEILASLVMQTRPGGYVIASFWQFLNNEDLRNKAQAVHEHALKELGSLLGGGLADGDCLLGWKNLPGAYRYCHSFSDAEIGQLAESVADIAAVVSRLVSDGRTNNLNTYLILRRT